ncbi:MAG TPA: zinc-dependent alcohol dehydrogenase family protein [Dehalococcoidia bacterium]|jgi:propanol-preferring alcohol dehydrogenase|nr:zinc-dependent alcohol dehydrogenase family protein [Dehalococcoidia bacterium]
MKAQILKAISPVENRPLELTSLSLPQPEAREIRVKISACGVCHTELDEIEGRLKPKLPVVLGHEIIGRVDALGPGATKFKIGDRVGIAWIYSACGRCRFCREGRENLCPEFQGTGCHADGGYAQYMVVREDFAYPIPAQFSDSQAAPLLCAGAIGYRDLKLSGIKPGQILGLFGFGASAHIVIQVARYWGCPTFVFSRSPAHRHLAEKLGAAWTGSAEDTPPEKVDCAIDFTPVGETVPQALKVLEKGGRLVLAVIRKRTPIPPLDYGRLLWEEKEIKSVANITRKDAQDFLPLAAEIPIIPEVQEFKLEAANEALIRLKQGKIQGAAVLRMD